MRLRLIIRRLYRRLIAYIENKIDKKAVGKADFSKGKDFGTVAEELGIWVKLDWV